MFGFGVRGSFNADEEIPDLSGKVILVTGGNAGLGKESVTQFAKHNPKEIFITARSHSKAETTIADIKSAVPNAKITPLILDLSDFASIDRAVQEFHSKSSRLDILLNNAGIMAVPYSTTQQGYEVQFGTNHMGPALLTKLLLPTLLKTAELHDSDVRIVNLSSYGHNLAPANSTIWDSSPAQKEDTRARYSSSKLANILHARILAEKYPQVTVTSVHPGVIMTDLYASMKEGAVGGFVFKAFAPLLFRDVHAGALNSLWACTAPKEQVRESYYFEPIGSAHRESKRAKDHPLAVDLWEYTEAEFAKHGFKQGEVV